MHIHLSREVDAAIEASEIINDLRHNGDGEHMHCLWQRVSRRFGCNEPMAHKLCQDHGYDPVEFVYASFQECEG